MRILSLSAIFLMLLGCSDPKTRPETADKLKPILVLVNAPIQAKQPIVPLNPANWDGPPVAGGTVNLQFHFIAPPGTVLTLVPTVPEPRPLTLPFNAWSIAPAVPYEYPGLQHTTFTAVATLPSAEVLAAAWPRFAIDGFVRLRYAMLVSDGSRELEEAGDFIVYKDATIAGATHTLFGSTIDSPAQNETVGGKTLDISSTLQNAQGEPVKIGWYVSDGKVKNRRAESTEWELPGSGEYTLVFTVRGKESRNGDIQIHQITMP